MNRYARVIALWLGATVVIGMPVLWVAESILAAMKVTSPMIHGFVGIAIGCAMIPTLVKFSDRILYPSQEV